MKFFLHISKEEQRKRFLERIDRPEKNWKFSAADMKERELWNDYMRAYEDCLRATSTPTSPWHVVPADDKRNARLIISQIVVDTLQSLKLTYPKTDKTRLKDCVHFENNWRMNSEQVVKPVIDELGAEAA